MKYMLDANVLRHIAAKERGFENILLRIREVGVKNLWLSVIVAAELYKAINNHKLERAEREALKKMLDALTVFHFDIDEAMEAGELAAEASRKGITIPSPDYLIAGHALSLGCVVVTDNVKHFAGIEGLRVENWIRP